MREIGAVLVDSYVLVFMCVCFFLNRYERGSRNRGGERGV